MVELKMMLTANSPTRRETVAFFFLFKNQLLSKTIFYLPAKFIFLGHQVTFSVYAQY